MTDLTADKFLGDGARKLTAPENGELLRCLSLFVDMWGLDAYTPPDDVEACVRQIVKAMVAAARKEAQTKEPKA